jgi:DNA-dependent protein kinase catalytic subunit
MWIIHIVLFQFLPIPELMPFRLTRQISNLMLPLQVKGLIESTMIHVLRALRSDSDLLLNTMDVFVKEPSLDWQVSVLIVYLLIIVVVVLLYPHTTKL